MKVTSHARSAAIRKQRINYLAHGSRHVENERGERLEVTDAAEQSLSWQTPTRRYGPNAGRAARHSTQVVLSFPVGTSPKVVEYVARDFAAENFAGHEYCWAVHARRERNPHAHFVVNTAGVDRALQTNRQDIQRWREYAAQRSRSFGLSLQAHAHTYRLRAERWITGPAERMLVRTGQLARARAERLLASIRRQSQSHLDIEQARQQELTEDARALVATSASALAQRAADMMASELSKPRLFSHTPVQRADLLRTAATVQKACPGHEGLGRTTATLARAHSAAWKHPQTTHSENPASASDCEARTRAQMVLRQLRRQQEERTATNEPVDPPPSPAPAVKTGVVRTSARRAWRVLRLVTLRPQALREHYMARTQTLVARARRELDVGGDRADAARRATRQLIRTLARPRLVARTAEETSQLLQLTGELQRCLHWREQPAELHAWAENTFGRPPKPAPEPRRSKREGPFAAAGRVTTLPARAALASLRLDAKGFRARQAMRTQVSLLRLRGTLDSAGNDARALSAAAQQFLKDTRRPHMFSYTDRERQQLRDAARCVGEKLPPESRVAAALEHARDTWSQPDRDSFVAMECRRPRLAHHRGVDNVLGVVETAARQQARRVLEGLRVGPDAFRIREVQRTSRLLADTRRVLDQSPGDPASARAAADKLLRGLRKPTLFRYTQSHQKAIWQLAGQVHAALPAQDKRRRAALRVSATHLDGNRHLTASLPRPNAPFWRAPTARPAALMRAHVRARTRNVLARLRVDADAFRIRQSLRTRQAIERTRRCLTRGEPARAAAHLLGELRRPRLFRHEQDDRRLLITAARDIADRLPAKATRLRRHLRWQEQKLCSRMPDSTHEHALRAETRARERARAKGKKPARHQLHQADRPLARTMVKSYFRQQAGRVLHVLRVHPERLRARLFEKTHRFVARLNAELAGNTNPLSYSRMQTDKITPKAAKRTTKRFIRGVNQTRLLPHSPPERYLLLGVAATLQAHLPAHERRLTRRLSATVANLASAQRTYQQSLPRQPRARLGPRWRDDIGRGR